MSASTIDTTGLPSEVLGLGSATAEYPFATSKAIVGGIVLFLLSAGICGAAALVRQSGKTDLMGLGIMVSCGVLVLIAAAAQVFATIRDTGMRIIVFEKGLARVGGSKKDIVPWDDITMVYQEITDRYRNGIKIATTHVYTLDIKNKDKIVFNDTISNVEQLGRTIQNEVTNRVMPRCVEALSAGKTIPFGKLTIARAGIGNGEETIPWADVQEVKVVEGKISVRKQGKWLNWARQTAGETPNLFIFLSLINQAVGINQKH